MSLLKSESSPAERNYMKHSSNNTDSKIKGKISDIRMMLSRLGNKVTNNDRKKITKELYEIKKRKTFQIRKKKRIMIILSI